MRTLNPKLYKKERVLMNAPNQLPSFQKSKTYASLIECAKQIPDRRVEYKINYDLWIVIVIAICAILAGADNFVAVQQYANERKRWLKEYFAIGGAIPSHDTFNRVFSLIHPKSFSHCITKWLRGLVPQSKIINIDGKVIEGYRSKDPFTLVRTWACETRSLLSQIRVPYGTNEITAIPMLLETLDIKDKIITIDAIGAQKKIVKQIAEKEAHYLISLKANQHAFYNDIKLFLDSIVNGEMKDAIYTYHETTDHEHGRVEKRRCWSTEDIDWLQQKTLWKNLRSLSVIETIIIRDGRRTENRRYFISSLEASALLIMEVVRYHWSIENQLHWHLDVTFDEDKSKTRGVFVAQNLSLLRAIAISLLSLLPLAMGFARKRQTLNRRPSLLKKILLA
jgi:predicted transposase YbfD/YdcC